MSQAMAAVARNIRSLPTKKFTRMRAARGVDDTELISKLTILLRCSYLRLTVGVACSIACLYLWQHDQGSWMCVAILGVARDHDVDPPLVRVQNDHHGDGSVHR